MTNHRELVCVCYLPLGGRQALTGDDFLLYRVVTVEPPELTSLVANRELIVWIIRRHGPVELLPRPRLALPNRKRLTEVDIRPFQSLRLIHNLLGGRGCALLLGGC